MPVYKSKEPTKDGRSWFFKCQYKDAYGEVHSKKSKKYMLKKEAEEAEREFLRSCGETISNKIIWDDVVKEFLENSHNKDGTLYAKKVNINKYGDIFNGKNIDLITPNLVEKWKIYMKSQQISVKSMKKIYHCFKSIFTYAVKKSYVTVNPFTVVGNFEEDPNKVENADETRLYLTPNEFNKFISVIDDEFWKFFFSFAFYMGTRKGEQIAIQWKDIDFNNHTVKIYKQINIRGLKKDNLFIPTKNNVTRTISIPTKVWNMLINKYKADKSFIGFNDNYFVFGDIKYTSMTTIDRYKDYYFKISGVKRITMHQFRHSHASLLISNNVPLNVIAKRLGDTPDIVAQTYAHLFPQKEAEVLNVLDKF